MSRLETSNFSSGRLLFSYFWQIYMCSKRWLVFWQEEYQFINVQIRCECKWKTGFIYLKVIFREISHFRKPMEKLRENESWFNWQNSTNNWFRSNESCLFYICICLGYVNSSIEHLVGDGSRYVGWTRQSVIPLSLIKLFIIKDTPTFSLVFVNFFNLPHKQ